MKPKIPVGWKQVKRGYNKIGDRIWDYESSGWLDITPFTCPITFNWPIRSCEIIIRRIKKKS